MADHRFRTDDELVRRLKSARCRQLALQNEIATLEDALGQKRGELNNSRIQVQWLVRYLAEPEGLRLASPPEIRIDGDLTN